MDSYPEVERRTPDEQLRRGAEGFDVLAEEVDLDEREAAARAGLECQAAFALNALAAAEDFPMRFTGALPSPFSVAPRGTKTVSVCVAATARVPRPRRRASRSRRARSPGRQDDDDSEPAPALAGRYTLTCDSCGEAFASQRPHARTCTARCRQRLHISRTLDADILRLADVARGLILAGQLDPEDALALVIWPSEQLLSAVEAAA